MGTKNSSGANPEQPADEAELRRRIDAGSQDPEDYQALAELLYSSGRHEEAKPLLDRTLDLNLTDLQRGEVLIEHASWLYEFDREKEVLELAKVGLGLLPSNRGDDLEVISLRAKARSLIAFCLWSDEPEAAKEAAHLSLRDLQQLWTERPGSELAAFGYYEATALNGLLERFEDVIRFAKQCLQIEQDEANRLHCMIWLGAALRGSEDLAEAREVLQRALRNVEVDESQLPNILLALGLVELDDNHLGEAKEHFKAAAEALRTDPKLNRDDSFIMTISVSLGHACLELSEYREAIVACEKVIAKEHIGNSDHWQALVWLGWCHLELRDYSQARSLLEEVLASTHVGPDIRELAIDAKRELHWRLAQSFYNSEEFGQAASEFESLLSLHPEDNEDRCRTILWLGNCRAAVGEWTRARNCYEVVLASPGATKKQKALAGKFLGQNRWLPGFLRKWIQ